MLRTALLAVFALAFLSQPASAFNMGSTSYNITDAVIATGGDISASASYKLDMTLGQPVVNYSASASYKLYFGRAWSTISGIIESMQTGVTIEDAKVTVSTGDIGKITVTLSNGGSTSRVFPMHIGSFDQSKNWAWFTGHRTDENRRDMNITLRPYEKRVVTIDFQGVVPGAYKLIIGPDEDYANRYDEVPLNIVYKSKGGLFSTTPDIGAVAFSLVVLAAAFIGVSSGRRAQR